MVLCWRTEIHVQFTNYKVQAVHANEGLWNWWACELMKEWKAAMQRLMRNLVTVEMQRSCVEKLKGWDVQKKSTLIKNIV